MTACYRLALMSMQRRSDGEIMRATQENRQKLERLLEKAESGRLYTAFRPRLFCLMPLQRTRRERKFTISK